MVKCVTSTWSSRETGYFSDVADSSVEFSAAQHVIQALIFHAIVTGSGAF